MGIGEDIKQSTFRSEAHKAVINILFTSSWIGQQHQQFFKPYGLTTPQYNTLRILRGQHPNPATVSLIMDRMIDKSSNASRIVDKLETKGYVQKCRCSQDKRAMDICISAAGLELLAKLDDELQEMAAPLNELNAEECAQLNKLLDKIRL